jgi:hypothetical protein
MDQMTGMGEKWTEWTRMAHMDHMDHMDRMDQMMQEMMQEMGRMGHEWQHTRLPPQHPRNCQNGFDVHPK